MKKSSRNPEWNVLKRHNSSMLSPLNLCSETAAALHSDRTAACLVQSPHFRLLNRPIDDLLVGAHFVIANDGRFLPRSDREVEPAARALFGLQRRSLQSRLFFGTIRGNCSSVSKMDLEKRWKGEAIGRGIRAGADLHVSTNRTDRGRPRDRINRDQMSACGCLFLAQRLRLRA